MSESRLQSRFIKKCKKAGMIAVKIECPSRKGWPDVLVVTDWGIKLVEVKSDTGRGRLSEHQKRVHAELCAMGESVAVLDTDEGMDNWIRDYRYKPY